MKTKNLIIAAFTSLCFAASAQWPGPPFSFNTADNGSGSVLPNLTNDLNWKCATSLNGAYTIFPKRVLPASGWHNGVSNPTFPANATWISYPHTCTGDAKDDYCNCTSINSACVDNYYEVSFNLTGSGTYQLNLTLMADNIVMAVYLNGVVAYSAPTTQTASGSPYYGGYLFVGHQSGKQVNVSLPSGAAQFIVPGLNTLRVHVRSGVNDLTRGWTGLFVSHTKSYSPGTPPPSDCCLGNECGNTQNALTSDYEIPMGGFDFNFSGDQQDQVNVGYQCSTTGPGKLNSFTDKKTNIPDAGNVGLESIAIHGHNLFSGPQQNAIGVMGEAENHEIGGSIGVWGNAVGAQDNTGGNFFAGISRPGMTRYNVGVSGFAFPSTGNTIPYTYKTIYPSANIGVYGACELANSDEDGNLFGADWAGWFDGDVNIVGNCFQNLNFEFSDRRFKKNISPLENVTEKIQKLNGYSYYFRSDEFKERGFDNTLHIGFIAQELKEVFPELVKTDSKGFLAVNYDGMIPVLLQAVKEQQDQINELKAMVAAMAGKPTVDAAKNAETAVELSDKNIVVLDQNVPNPFAESTIISYNIPNEFSRAQIVFSNHEGVVIKTVDIIQAGAGRLNVFANDLTNGLYSYSLVVDGNVVDTKKMIKQ